jgi:glycerol-3-phosphate dehydrogenase
VAAEAVYGVRYEMAQCLEDVLSRRTRALLVDAAASRQAATAVAKLMASELGWDDDRIADEVASLEALVAQELGAVARPDAHAPKVGGASDSLEGDAHGAAGGPVLEVGS